MIAHALRERVFELRYPSRLMEIGDDAPLIDIFEAARHAPSAEAFLLSLARLFKPALLAAYREYEQLADELADGPILRALRTAIAEKMEQVAALTTLATAMLQAAPERSAEAEAWVAALGQRLTQVGGVSVEPPTTAPALGRAGGSRPFQLAEIPARDPRFHLCRYYWPDVVDPAFPMATASACNCAVPSATSTKCGPWKRVARSCTPLPTTWAGSSSTMPPAGPTTRAGTRAWAMSGSRVGATAPKRFPWVATSTTARGAKTL